MYNTISMRVNEMSVKPRRSVFGRGDEHVLIYAALFLVCALLSALGASLVGVLAFLPAVIAVEALMRLGEHGQQRRQGNYQRKL